MYTHTNLYIYAYVCICAYILPEPSILNILGHGREPPRPQPCPIYLPLRPMTLAVTVFPQAVYAQHTFCLLFVCVSSYMSNTKAQEKVSIEVVHPCLVCFDLGVHSYMPWCSTHVHVCSMSFLKNQWKNNENQWKTNEKPSFKNQSPVQLDLL